MTTIRTTLQNLSISIILLLFICFQCTSSQSIDNVVSCSGFVRLSPDFGSQYKPNLSEIKIIAKTSSGIIKETVECSPHGFFLLPIYDIGTYKLEVQGPSGWSFEPKSVTISIENNSCNDGNDINFIVTGFSIYGSVKTDEKERKGIAGVEIHLKDKSGADLQIVTSSEDGSYTFSNVKPGSYVIAPVHPSWTLSEKQIDVQVSQGNLNVEKEILVTGYDLFGSVLSVGGEPMAGVDFTLVQQSTGKTISQLSSNDEGKFHFTDVPCGTYELRASYLSDTTTFEVSPLQTQVEICRKSVEITTPFRIVGFSVIGKVMNKDKGLEGVSIFVNGEQKALTTSDGVYKWEKANEGTYSITASKDHYEFSSLKNINISPSKFQISDIKVEKYHVCGKLIVDTSFPTYSKVREVNVKNLANSQTFSVKTTTEGNYCFFTEAGEFVLSPVQAEESKGLLFTPNQKKITVTDSPVLNQDFRQSKVAVSGSISPKIEFHTGNIEIKLIDSHTKQQRQSTYVDENSEFHFADVFPGNYVVEVGYEQWCWQSNSLPLSVSTEDVNNLKFERTGHKFAFILNADVHLDFNESPELSKVYSKGKHEICLPNLEGVYEYKITPKSCFKFEKDTYVFSVKNNQFPKPLKISFTHIEVSGSILTTQADTSLTVTVTATNNNAYNPQVKLISSNNNVFEYGYSFWGLPGDSLTITPTSDTLLFYPRVNKVLVHTQEKCMDKLPNFEGRTGKYFEGKINPPMGGVKVVVYSKDTKEVFTTAVSTEAGTYIVGPLYDDIHYDLTASLEGYNFVRSGDNFEAIELAKLTIQVVDNEGKAINGAVLLSLTSGDGFRRNNITDENGQFTFEELFPGFYFLKPLLKEYNFNPSTMEIEVTAGAEIKKTIKAVRVAYSCFGSVKSLNLSPEKLLTIQAKSIDGTEIEETQSDENGNFRVRGLKPNKEYQITVKTGAKVDRSSPSHYQFVVPSEDVRDVNFTIFKKFNKYELTGAVHTNDPNWIPTLYVQLFSEKEDTLVRAIKLGPSNVFNFPLLPKENYYIRLNTTLSSKIYDFKIEDIPVVFDSDATFVEIDFNADFHVYNTEIAHTPFYYLLVIVLGIVLYIYRRPVKELIHKYQTGKWSDEEGPIVSKPNKRKNHK